MYKPSEWQDLTWVSGELPEKLDKQAYARRIAQLIKLHPTGVADKWKDFEDSAGLWNLEPS